MQTLNAIANEDYYNANSSHESWIYATETPQSHQNPANLTTSSEPSPMLGAEDLFTGLETIPNNHNTPLERSSGTSCSGSDSSVPKRRIDSPSPTGNSADGEGHKVQKRQRNTEAVRKNTEAARRYRQRKVDKVSELEEALKLMTKERDDLRLRLARSETEADVLRGLVGKTS